MQRRILILFFLLVSSSPAYASELSDANDRVLYLLSLYEPVVGQYRTSQEVPRVAEIVDLYNRYTLAVARRPIYLGTNSLGSLLSLVTSLETGIAAHPEYFSSPESAVSIPVEFPDFDYEGVVLTLLGYVSGIAVLAIGLCLSLWGVLYLFRLFKGFVR